MECGDLAPLWDSDGLRNPKRRQVAALQISNAETEFQYSARDGVATSASPTGPDRKSSTGASLRHPRRLGLAHDLGHRLRREVLRETLHVEIEDRSDVKREE